MPDPAWRGLNGSFSLAEQLCPWERRACVRGLGFAHSAWPLFVWPRCLIQKKLQKCVVFLFLFFFFFFYSLFFFFFFFFPAFQLNCAYSVVSGFVELAKDGHGVFTVQGP